MDARAWLAGCLLLTAGTVALAASAESGTEARQAPSCGEWVVHREKSDTLALGNASWLRGYLAGLAAGSGKDFLAATDNASIYKWMDNYCRTSPLRDLGSGGNALAAELTGKKATAK
jgi:hypothetical protein